MSPTRPSPKLHIEREVWKLNDPVCAFGGVCKPKGRIAEMERSSPRPCKDIFFSFWRGLAHPPPNWNIWKLILLFPTEYLLKLNFANVIHFWVLSYLFWLLVCLWLGGHYHLKIWWRACLLYNMWLACSQVSGLLPGKRKNDEHRLKANQNNICNSVRAHSPKLLTAAIATCYSTLCCCTAVCRCTGYSGKVHFVNDKKMKCVMQRLGTKWFCISDFGWRCWSGAPPLDWLPAKTNEFGLPTGD